ncbi:MAG TPA: hypothetical protein VFT39_19615 [Vicinamibacterales bacterium]|nr:hypothetical protein [Vicinamibacterales bacterium]
MRNVITRAAILTGAILFANVAVESAGPVLAPATVTSASTRMRQVTVPAGTVLRLRLTRGFGSDSRLEAPVSGTLLNPIVVDGRTALRQGSVASGYVAEATRPGKVKGRGRVAVRFTRITPAGFDERYNIQTRSWVAVAPATKKKDAITIGAPAAGGAVVGGIIGGKKGAGIGALAGGGAGTAVVLSTRGKDVHIGPGTTLAIRLVAPLTVSVPE